MNQYGAIVLPRLICGTTTYPNVCMQGPENSIRWHFIFLQLQLELMMSFQKCSFKNSHNKKFHFQMKICGKSFLFRHNRLSCVRVLRKDLGQYCSEKINHQCTV